MALDRNATAKAIAELDALAADEKLSAARCAKLNGADLWQAKRDIATDAQVTGHIAWLDSPDPRRDPERTRGALVIHADGALVRVPLTPGRAKSLMAWLGGLLK